MKNLFSSILFFSLFQCGYGQNFELNDIAGQYLNEFKVPGLAISVIKSDKVLFGTAGLKQCGTENRIDLDSKFQMGSNSKAITATIVAILVEGGKIEWDAKLLEIVPSLKGGIKEVYESITLEDLLSNRGFIQPFEESGSREWKGIPQRKSGTKISKLTFAKYALNLKPKIGESKEFSYSNGGFIIAALMLEQASGKSWQELIELYSEFYKVDLTKGFPNQETPNQTFGHKKRLRKYKPVLSKDELYFNFDMSPAGNLSISIKDMTKVMSNHLAGLLGSDDGVLSAESYKKLHFGRDGYSLGWYNGNIGETEQRFSYHGGSLETFSSSIMISSDRDIAIIIMVNSDDKNSTELRDKLRVELWEKYRSE